MLKVESLDVAYGEIRALKGVALEVGPGEIVTILGNNGAGKTTTLKTISGLLRPTRGTITLENEPLVDVPPHAIVARGVAHVPEGRRIFNRLTVRENLMMGAYLRDDSGIAGDLERVFGLFPRLSERLVQVAGTLSGGEQQMLALSRAISTRPTLLLLDELSMGLAPLIVTQMYDTVRELADEGLSILVAEQFARTVLPIAHSAGIMLHGRIVRMGSPSKIEEELSTHYLGG